jgi:hypothetical protein
MNGRKGLPWTNILGRAVPRVIVACVVLGITGGAALKIKAQGLYERRPGQRSQR